MVKFQSICAFFCFTVGYDKICVEGVDDTPQVTCPQGIAQPGMGKQWASDVPNAVEILKCISMKRH